MRATLLSRGRLMLPDGGRLPGGLWVHASCRQPAVLANNVAGHLTGISVGLVPARSAELELPFDNEVLVGILDRVPALREDRDWVVLRPSDARRARIMILGLDEERRPAVFVKVTLDEPNPLALRLLRQMEKTNSDLVFPRVIDVFPVGKWWVTAERPLPQRPHTPARLDLERLHALVDMIQGLLPASNGLVCAHGDFGPWNVREYPGGRLGILDWEYAHWSPKAVDELWYLLTLRLSTTRDAGERIGRRVRDQLGGLYADQEISNAAEFIVKQRSGPEPAEIREEVGKAGSLLRFEGRLEAALAAVAGMS